MLDDFISLRAQAVAFLLYMLYMLYNLQRTALFAGPPWGRGVAYFPGVMLRGYTSSYIHVFTIVP